MSQPAHDVEPHGGTLGFPAEATLEGHADSARGTLPARFPRTAWRDAFAGIAPLAIGGVAALCILAAVAISPSLAAYTPRADVWAAYLALGTLFPLLLMLGLLLRHRGRTLPVSMAIFLVFLVLVTTLFVIGPVLVMIALTLGQLQALICLAMASQRERVTPSRAAAVALTSVLSWAFTLVLFTWEPLVTLVPPSWLLLLVGAIALVASCWWGLGQPVPPCGWRLQVRYALDVLAIIVLVLLAFRTDGLFTTDRLGADGTFYHWGTLVGPAEAVRQGGWLLWDVSSPYGFLTTLAIAGLPTTTSWQSLYLLNALASAALAVWVYFVLRTVRPVPGGSVFALAATAAVVFLVSTYPPTLSPEHYFPQSGAFRYGWCYVLVGVLLLERTAAPGSRRQRVILLAGCGGWLASMLWSAESACYGSAIWLPAFVLIVLRDHGFFARTRTRDWKGALGWLAVPPVVLAVAIMTIAAVYRLALGQGPDAPIYVSAIVSFTGSTAADVSGLFPAAGFASTVPVVVWGFLLLAIAAFMIGRKTFAQRELPTALGLGMGMWGLLSYPVGQPFLFNVYRLMPFLVLGLAIVLAFLAPKIENSSERPWIDTIRMGSVALLTALLATVFANPAEVQYYVAAIQNEPFIGRDVSVGLPRVEPSLETLLQQAGVQAGDPIFYAGGAYGDMMPVWTPHGSATPVFESQQWLTGPFSTLVFRPEQRQKQFLERSGARQQHGGWLIERADRSELVYAVGSWFFEQLNATFVPTRFAANQDWILTWYEPIGQSVHAARPLPDGQRNPGLVPDLWFTGRTEEGAIFPATWGIWGPEWSEPTSERLSRCADGRGSLLVFSNIAREARLTLGFPNDAFEGALRITTNGSAPVPSERTRNGKLAAQLPLEPGWNTIIIDVAEPDPAQLAAEGTTAGCAPTGTLARPLQATYLEIRTRE